MLNSRSLFFALVAAVAALAIGGCGGSRHNASAASAKPLVEQGRPPLITGLAVDPAGRSLLLATNIGLYRVSSDGRKLQPIGASARESAAHGPYGERVSSLAFDGAARLLGSGHPNRVVDHLPPFLGLLESRDGGQSWKGIARAGFSDLHVLLVQSGIVYAFDTILGGVVVSRDGGHNFVEETAPEGPTVLDMAVDPRDGRYILASTPQALFASTDDGASWHRLVAASEARLTWTAVGLFRADADGTVMRSPDRGVHWSAVGKLPGTPGKLIASGGELYAALDNARIYTSGDGGAAWKLLFKP